MVANRKCNRGPVVAKGMAGSKPLTRGKRGSWAHATGSHVFWKGKPLTSWKKGIAGSGNRKSRGWEGKTADQVEKSIVGSRGRKTAEKTRAQSPKSKSGSGGDP